MPYSASGEPTTTVEDLQDLLDFEKSNPGQVRTGQKLDLNCLRVEKFALCYLSCMVSLVFFNVNLNEFMLQ